MARRLAIAVLLAGAAGVLVACGSQEISASVKDSTPEVRHGGQLFAERCAGCHSLSVVGANGTTLNPGQRERTDGPNFNVRREKSEDVLYAIRNGGYSGAIMPENIVVGTDAQDVAAFLAKYSGRGK